MPEYDWVGDHWKAPAPTFEIQKLAITSQSFALSMSHHAADMASIQKNHSRITVHPAGWHADAVGMLSSATLYVCSLVMARLKYSRVSCKLHNAEGLAKSFEILAW